MRVLFVSSGNSEFGISPIVYNQGESLRKHGIELEYYTIKGKGVVGYLSNSKSLKNYLKKNEFNIVHSHYSFSSFITSLAGAKNQVVSLMGSDVNSGFFYRIFIKLFYIIFWRKCIVKSEGMKRKIGLKSIEVIPNGVQVEKFKPLSREECVKELKWNIEKKHILFMANPRRIEKNFNLAELAFNLLNTKEIELHTLKNVPPEEMVKFYNASDVVLLTSLWEGSPNVIKESMACNCPIVSTDVGDVKWVIGETEGCYLTSFDLKDVCQKIRMALEFAENEGKTKGRERIIMLKLNSESVANRIKKIYKKLVKI